MKIRAREIASRQSDRESGQAAAVVALFLFFVFLAFASLAIDGAMTYLVRRDLQNVADSAALAACRVMAYQDTSTTPMQAALNIVAQHLGSTAEFAGDDPPNTNIGAGAGLVKGIEVPITSTASTDLRVALQRRVPTVLTQFFGRSDSIMGAKAHCDSTAGGGLLPIAIQRYDIGSKVDYLANQNALSSGVLYSDTSQLETWDGRYGPFNVPVPVDPWIASPTNPGPEVVILGQQAETNNGESNMRDLVLLDIRNIVATPPEYYNGADSQADAAKDMSQNWIYTHGYPGPFPQTGSQVAILDGANTNFAAGAMDLAGYNVGDVVAAIVYDGFVWTKPDFGVSVTPKSGNGIAAGFRPVDASTAVSYTVSIGCSSPCPGTWIQPLDFDLTFDLTEKPGGALPPGIVMELDGVPMTPGVPFALPSPVPQSGWNSTLRIWETEPITVVAQYLSGLNVAARYTGLFHGASSNFGFGAVGTYDYALRSDHGQLVVEQGSSSTANPVVGANSSFPGGQGCKDVPLSARILLNGTEQSWSSYFSSPQNITLNIKKNTGNNYDTLSFALDVKPGAPVTPSGASNTLRLTLGGASSNCNSPLIPTHQEDIPIVIAPLALGGTPNKFVIIQGYALFEVTRYYPPNSGNPNTVYGESISPLYESYSDIKVGLRPRLVPWQ